MDRSEDHLAGALPVPEAAAVRRARGARRRVAGAAVPLHFPGPAAIPPSKLGLVAKNW